jgi:hypothetical protein
MTELNTFCYSALAGVSGSITTITLLQWDFRANSMEQSPTRDANSRSASQEISQHLTESECSLQCSQDPATGPIPEPREFSN